VTQLPDPIVQIAPGRVRGVWRGGSAAFLGIPFAQPPIGDLRFAAPVPPEPWSGVRDAVAYGATPQLRDAAQPTLIPEPSVSGESTLNVNVFTPRPGEIDASLPVLVYIHGGGYTTGSPASPWYDGAAFNRDGVVTVTLSYRLGFEGFGYIPGAPSNRGVRDWLAALEWVRDNIAAFGGDPARVTIAGQSAGGGAVLTLLGMPAAQGLFSAAWALSAALSDVAPERARTQSAKLANSAGVAPTRTGFESVPAARLLELQDAAAAPASTDPLARIHVLLEEGLAWGPMIDGDLLTQPTIESLRDGVGSGIPLVLGATDDEFTVVTDRAKHTLRLVPAALGLSMLKVDAVTRKAYLAANTAQRRKGTAAVLGRYVTDVKFRAIVLRAAQARRNSPTWVYRFSWISPVKGWACHCLDVPFWFDCLDAERVDAIAGDAPPPALAAALHGSAVAFIRDGHPGWPAWTDASRATRIFGGDASRPDVRPDGYASVRALL
jgi:para-nitrobenzyl esterase